MYYVYSIEIAFRVSFICYVRTDVAIDVSLISSTRGYCYHYDREYNTIRTYQILLLRFVAPPRGARVQCDTNRIVYIGAPSYCY